MRNAFRILRPSCGAQNGTHRPSTQMKSARAPQSSLVVHSGTPTSQRLLTQMSPAGQSLASAQNPGMDAHGCGGTPVGMPISISSSGSYTSGSTITDTLPSPAISTCSPTRHWGASASGGSTTFSSVRICELVRKSTCTASGSGGGWRGGRARRGRVAHDPAPRRCSANEQSASVEP